TKWTTRQWLAPQAQVWQPFNRLQKRWPRKNENIRPPALAARTRASAPATTPRSAAGRPRTTPAPAGAAAPKRPWSPPPLSPTMVPPAPLTELPSTAFRRTHCGTVSGHRATTRDRPLPDEPEEAGSRSSGPTNRNGSHPSAPRRPPKNLPRGVRNRPAAHYSP